MRRVQVAIAEWWKYEEKDHIFNARMITFEVTIRFTLIWV